MRVLLCSCGRRLVAADDDKLCEKVRDHLKSGHLVTGVDEVETREMVAAHSYCYEFAEVYAGVAEPDEEFGPEPY